MTTVVGQSTLTGFSPRTQALFQVTGFVPTAGQAPILTCRARNIVVTGGEQSGKSVTGAKKLLMEYPNDLLRAIEKAKRQNQPQDAYFPIIYWLVGEDYGATEREFGYLRDDFGALGWLRPGNYGKINPGTLKIMGGEGRNKLTALIKTKSARDARSLRMEAPSGIVVCEPGQLNLQAFERVLARTAPMEAWLMMPGTIEGGNGWFARIATQWGAGGPDKAWFRLPTSSNFYLYAGGEADPELERLRKESPDSFFKERFEGIPCPPRGIVFPEVRPDLHIASVPYSPGVAVQLWEDPGYGSDSAHALLAVQIMEEQVRVVAEVYERGQTTEVLIRDFVTAKPWWKDVELVLLDPHYSTQHHSTMSVEEIWRKATGIRVVVPKREHVMPRLDRVRSFLVPTATGAPKLVVDASCAGLLSEWGLGPNPFDGQDHAYRWRVDRDGNAVGEEPEDRWNHSCEALGRGLMHNFGPIGGLRRRTFRSQFFGPSPLRRKVRAK